MAEAAATLVERLEHRLARVLLRLPPALQVRLSGEPPVRRDGLQLHPELQLLLSIRKRRGKPGLSDLAPVESRRHARRESMVHAGESVPVAAVRDFFMNGPEAPLKARHYAPFAQADGPAPLLVFFHGGGFVVGDLDTHDSVCRLLCRHGNLHVLSVEYRLAPEHPFPAAVHDAHAAFVWARMNAATLGADPSRVAVGGDSAGGNLAAVISQRALDKGEPVPTFQLLLYPALDRTVEWPSMSHFAEGFFLTRADIGWFQRHYVGEAGAPGEPLANPFLATGRAKLPPALVVTAGFDPLRDEGEAYAEALRCAGIRVELKRFDGLIHGFANMVGVSPACRTAVIDIATRTRRLLAKSEGLV